MEPQLVAILIPSLWRPGKLDRVLGNIDETTPEEHNIYAVVDSSDLESQEVCEEHGVTVWVDDAGYFCERIQYMFEHTYEPWIFTGSDDIVFSEQWISRMFAAAQPHHAVISPNDGHNPKGTNYLINRDYIEHHGGNLGVPGYVYHPGYKHNFSDDDLVNSAIYNGVFVRAMDVLIESTHPCWGNGEFDATYGRVQPSSAPWNEDEALFHSREHLWGGKDLWR